MGLLDNIRNKMAGPLDHQKAQKLAGEAFEKAKEKGDSGKSAKICAGTLRDIYERGTDANDREMARVTLELMACCGKTVGYQFAPVDDMRSFPKSQAGLQGLKALGQGLAPTGANVAAVAASTVAGCPPWAAIEVGEKALQYLSEQGNDPSIAGVAGMGSYMAEKLHIDQSEPSMGLTYKGRAAVSRAALEYMGQGHASQVAGTVAGGPSGAVLAGALLAIAGKSSSAGSLSIMPGLSVGGPGESVIRTGLQYIAENGSEEASRNLARFGLEIAGKLMIFSEGKFVNMPIEAIQEGMPYNEDTIVAVSARMMKAAESYFDTMAIASTALQHLQNMTGDEKLRKMAAEGLRGLQDKTCTDSMKAALLALGDIEIYWNSKNEVNELVEGINPEKSKKSAILVEDGQEFIVIAGTRLEIKKEKGQ